jgi:hypothetical protein
MNLIKIYFTLIIVFTTNTFFGAGIQNYKPYFGISNSKNNAGTVRIAIRKFIMDNSEYLLIVDPHNLTTYIQKNASSPAIIETDSFSEIRRKYCNTPYLKALACSEKNASSLQNAGITHFTRINNGVILTADLCPSRLPMDNTFFSTIIDEFINTQRPVPVALSVTGSWMENHTEDIKRLKALEQKSMLSITWINHSYDHKFSKDLPIKNNFLLISDTDIDSEVLNTEKKMLESGIVPSVFFRFPGLISNRDIFYKITRYGLIPIGSDAWLAKNQWPKNGSIVLVHANGNEPEGILRFKELVKKERKNILNKRWILFDLRESVAGNE